MMKGVFFLIKRDLIEKKISNAFFKWKNKTESIRYHRISKKIEKHINRKKILTLILLDKIISKINIINSHQKLIFFEKLVLFCKLKNTLNQYGFLYKKIPDFLVNHQDLKGLCMLMRETYSKAFKLMKVHIILSRKKYVILYDKYNKCRKNHTFKLNNTFLKWKQYTLNCLSRSYKKSFALTRLKIVIYSNFLKNYLMFFKRIALKNPSTNLTALIEDKKILIYILEKIKAKRILIDKMNVINELKYIKQKKLRERAIILKDCILATFLIDQLNKAKIKNKFIRKWNIISKKERIFKRSIAFKKNDIINSIVFIKTIYKIIKYKIFKWFKVKSLHQKALKDSKKIDFYINLNQARACLELEKHEKELDKEFAHKRLKILNTDILCKLFLKTSLKEDKYVKFRHWKNKSIKKLTNFTDSFAILINERNILLQDKTELEDSMIQYKHQYDRVNDEYTEFKKLFCKNCLQLDECEIKENKSTNSKYKSNNYLTNMSKSNEFDISNEEEEFMIPNKIMSKELKHEEEEEEEVLTKKNYSDLKQKIVTKENQINTLKTEYDDKLQSNEKFLKIYEEKKKELLCIKREIISKIDGKIN